MTGKLPYIIFISLLAIFVFNYLGYRYDWYNLFSWYDVPMHVAGGAWLALAAIYVLKYRTAWASHMSPDVFAFFVIVAVLSVGVLWEIYEYSMDILNFKKYTFSTIPGDVRFDSAHDLVNDLIGALIVLIASRLPERRSPKQF